jgi:hypothetical protein
MNYDRIREELRLQANKLSIEHKKLYGNIDISEPKSKEEIISEKKIARYFSICNQILCKKRGIKLW